MLAVRYENPDVLGATYNKPNDGERFINEFFPGKTVKDLFPDILTLEPGSWSSHSHLMPNPNKGEQSDTFDVQLYREPLEKDGRICDDADAADGNYSGRFTIEMFYSDDGDFVGPCIDCGRPERYRS